MPRPPPWPSRRGSKPSSFGSVFCFVMIDVAVHPNVLSFSSRCAPETKPVPRGGQRLGLPPERLSRSYKILKYRMPPGSILPLILTEGRTGETKPREEQRPTQTQKKREACQHHRVATPTSRARSSSTRHRGCNIATPSHSRSYGLPCLPSRGYCHSSATWESRRRWASRAISRARIPSVIGVAW
jgi:hypothetical protein